MSEQKSGTGLAPDGSLSVAERAFAAMKAHGSPAYPRSFEVWFTHVSAQNQRLSAAINRAIAEKGIVGGTEIDEIYDSHLNPQRFPAHAERTSAGVLGEIEHVMEMIDLAMGSNARYDDTLVSLTKDLDVTKDLDANVDRNRIRQIVEALVLSTRDASGTNKTLSARLSETRREIETLRETLAAVRVDALTDSLTGIANRRHFEDMLIRATDEAAVQRRPLSLIMIDIDHFKRFNETYGHLTGDQVLRLVAATMRDKVKSKATLARFGGEEYAILLPDTTLESAKDIGEQIRQAVMSRELVKRSTGESLGRVTISLGIAAMHKGDSAVLLLERADQCLVAAKRTGRNRAVQENDPLLSADLPFVA